MEDQFNFDLNFDFLDSTTSIAKPNGTISSSYAPIASPQVLDVESLANKIASVNDLVLQLKAEKEAHAILQKQMQALNESAMSIRNLYEQEKAEKGKYALLSQELKEKCEAAESQLINKTLHFEQLASKIEQTGEKGPIPYDELILRYHRLALHMDEDKDLNHKEKQRLQQIQEYMAAKKLSSLTPFKKKKKHQNVSVHKDQGTQHYPEMTSKSTFTDFEVTQKKFTSQGTQHTSYTTTRSTNTENQNARKEMKTQGTQYISSVTTRSTSTTGFIQTRSVGTNFPDESTKLVDDIFSEMIFDIVPLSPIAEEELPPPEKVEMKTVGTITGLKNVQKPIDYVTPVSIKSSDSRPPSRNMFERVKNELPFAGVPSMNSFVESGANPTSVPNNITDLWNLLGHTFFSLLQNVNLFNNSVNLNVINDRIRNTNMHINNSENQQRCSDSATNFGRNYFDETCSNGSNPRVFHSATRSTATSPIAELEAPLLQNQRFCNETLGKAQPPTGVPNANNRHTVGNVNSCAPVEIQKIVLNKILQEKSTEQSKEEQSKPNPVIVNRTPSKKPKKKCKSCRKLKRLASDVEENIVSAFSERPRSKSFHSCAHETQLSFTCGGTSSHSEEQSSLSSNSQIFPDTSISSNLEDELFGTSDEDERNDEIDSNVTLPVSVPTCNQADKDVFCKPFMPKKRKPNLVDTRIFHIEDLKATQYNQSGIISAQNNVTQKLSAHPKRKRSKKSTNKFSKIQIGSNSSLDSLSCVPGMPCSQEGEKAVKLFTDCSLKEKTLDGALNGGSSDVPICKRLNLSISSPHQPQLLTLETSTTENEGLRNGMRINKLGADNSSLQNKQIIFQEIESCTSALQTAQDERKLVIDVLPPTSKCDQLQNIKENNIQSGRLDNLPLSTQSLKMGDDTKILKKPENISNTSTSSSKMNQPCTGNKYPSNPNVCFPDQIGCSASEWAIPVSYSNQTANSNNYFDNIHLDDSNERLEEILHRISDEFSTPERPVSAIPPCDSSQAEESFSEEDSNVVSHIASVKEKTKRRRGCSTVMAVKRSERLKAKNLIREAIEYKQLKIPAIELGKYTKRKTDVEIMCADVTTDCTNPIPMQIDNQRVGSQGYVNIEAAHIHEMEPKQSPKSVSLQNSTSESEENTSFELVIDLPDEANTLQNPADVNSTPNEDNSNEISHTEPEASFNRDEFCSVDVQPLFIEESPSSPLPTDRDPDPNHTPQQIPEKINKKPKTNSLLSQIIANYNHDYHKKVMESRQEQDKVILHQLQATLSNFVNASVETESTERVVEQICSITTCEQLIVHSLVSEVKTAPRPEKESSSPLPELYLGQTLRKILLLLNPLYAQLPNMRIALLMNTEKSIFSFTKDFISLDTTLNLTQFYLALIADAQAPTNPARLFICKCLFFYTKKAVPMIYETLCVYPTVLPHRDDTTYDRSDALISTIQCVLMSTYYDTEKCDLKAKQLLYKLRNFYNYESLKPTREEVIENLIAKLRAGRFKNVSYSFAVICKRTDRNYIIKSILGERLLPLANEYYQTIGETTENDERIACVLECISYVIKPFPVDTDITTYINLYSRFLNAVDRQVVQEAAVSAILRTIRFGYVQCFTTIYNFQPKYEVSEEFKTMLRSFVYKKNLGYLRKLECQMHVLAQ